MNKWDDEQDKLNIPLIDRTYKVCKPNGEITEVNRFDMNLTLCVSPESWIQCTDKSWLSANRLTIIE